MTGMADNDTVQVETKAMPDDSLRITLSHLSADGVQTIHTMWNRAAAEELRDTLTRWLDGDLP